MFADMSATNVGTCTYLQVQQLVVCLLPQAEHLRRQKTRCFKGSLGDQVHMKQCPKRTFGHCYRDNKYDNEFWRRQLTLPARPLPHWPRFETPITLARPPSPSYRASMNGR